MLTSKSVKNLSGNNILGFNKKFRYLNKTDTDNYI